MSKRNLLSGCVALLAAMTVPAAYADITMKQRIAVEAGGPMSFMSSESTITSALSGDKSRTDSKTESKSRFMGSMGGNLDTVSITRLDKELMWNLSPEKQQYSEMTFEQLRAQMEKSMAQLEEMQQSGGAAALPVDDADCQWSEPELNVQDTGEKQQIANIKAKRHAISIQQTCAVPENNQTCVMTWKLDNWMAKDMPGKREAKNFQKALAEKLGMGDMMTNMQGSSMAMLAMFRDGWDDALDEAKKLQGYPVKTVMQMEIGGENCTAASGQPIAMDDMWSNALDAGLNAAAQTAGAHAGQKISEETAEAMGDSVGGSIGGSAVGAASGEVIGGMLKRFGKKKKKKKQKQPQPAEPVATAPSEGSVVLFRVTTELTSVSDDKIPAEQFEVPAGWKKVSRSY